MGDDSLGMTKGRFSSVVSLFYYTKLPLRVMSGIITGPYFKAYFNQPEDWEIGTMVAILEVGAFCTSIAAGRIGDMFGRRLTLFWGAMVFVLGGAIQTVSVGFYSMVLGRIISGCGVGLLS
jgi:MFS family permease